MVATFSVTSCRVQVVICQHVKMCWSVKVLFEIPTFAVNDEDQLDKTFICRQCPYNSMWLWRVPICHLSMTLPLWKGSHPLLQMALYWEKQIAAISSLSRQCWHMLWQRISWCVQTHLEKQYSWWDLQQLPSIRTVMQCIPSMWHTQYSWKVSRNCKFREVDSQWIWLHDV